MNQNKSAYKTLYKYFYEKNIAVVAPVLPGHDTYENFGRVADESFNTLYSEVFSFIQKENNQALPVYFMGRSLGALGFMNYTNSHSIELDKDNSFWRLYKIKHMNTLLKIIPDCLGIPSLAHDNIGPLTSLRTRLQTITPAKKIKQKLQPYLKKR